MHYWHHLPVVPHFQDRVEIEELFSLFGYDTSVDEWGPFPLSLVVLMLHVVLIRGTTTLLSCFACHTDTKSKWTTIQVFAQIVLIRLTRSWTYWGHNLNILTLKTRLISY